MSTEYKKIINRSNSLSLQDKRTLKEALAEVESAAGAADPQTAINTAAIAALEAEDITAQVNEWSAQQHFGNGTLTDGATITWDLDADPIATITLGGDRTLNFINARAGGTYILKVVQDATGTRLITWDADVDWAGGTAPTLTTTANGYDVFSFVAFDDTTLVGATAGLEFS